MDVFTKYAQAKPLKTKTGKTVINDFIELVNESNRKPNKLWLIKEDSFIINLCKNGWAIMIFYCTPHIMKARQ